MDIKIQVCTGKLRYLEFQGNGENTSSFPKFEIANYDVTRIHVHEQIRLNTLSSFRKIALLQNVCTFVIRCVLPIISYPQISGKIMGKTKPTKLLDHFLNGILDISAARFQLTECKQRKSS